MEVNATDITVPWGQNPDPVDQQMCRWRVAVYQDLQASIDGSKLYWLYDPLADEQSGTSGQRKSGAALLVFDLSRRCFVREIPLSLRPAVEGVPKYLFALKSPSPTGGTSLILCTQLDSYSTLQFWRINLTADGLNIADQMMAILNSPVPVGDDWIVCLREDAPELALLTGPGLTVFRLNAAVNAPSAPVESFSVPDGDMRKYYDGFIWQGSFYLLASTDDGTFDLSHVHVLDITGQKRMVTTGTRPDPARGFPPPRKQAGLDLSNGHILLAGGEMSDQQTGQVFRLVDYWALDLSTFTWKQLQGQMPLPLIEPRLTAAGVQIYIWGDIDQPLPGICTDGTHLRILSVNGFAVDKPPNYATMTSAPPPYSASSLPPNPSGGGYMAQASPYQTQGGAQGYPMQQQSGYPQQQTGVYPQQASGYPQQQSAYQSGYPQQQQSGYPQQQQSGYPQQQQSGYPQQQQSGYPQQQPGYPQQQFSGYPPQGQQAYYPPDGNKSKKDCCIS